MIHITASPEVGIWDSPGLFNYVPSPLEAADVTLKLRIPAKSFQQSIGGMKQRALFFYFIFFKLLAARE